MDINIISTNLRVLIDTLQCYDYEFADYVGMNRTVLSYAINKNKSISIIQIYKIISKFPDLNLNWLIKGTGKMFENGYKPKPLNSSKPKNFAAI